MGVNLSIKDVPEEQVETLRQRAKRNHRSLQGELQAIIDTVVKSYKREIAIEELAEKGKRLGLTSASQSTQWMREDRDSR